MLNRPIVHKKEPVVIIGGGTFDSCDLSDALKMCPTVIAVDGGLMAALSFNCDVCAVVGDMDSVTPEALAKIPKDQVFKVSEQDSTDFEKALSRVEAPVLVALGFSGGRLDHQLAVLHGLMRYPERPCVLVGAEECAFLLPPALTLNLAEGDVMSLFPLASVSGRSTGLRWPIEGLNFAPGQVIGTSNAALGSVSLEMDRPSMIGLVPRSALSLVVGAFVRLPTAARWPALSE